MNEMYSLKNEGSIVRIIDNNTGRIIAENSISSKKKFDLELCTPEFINWLISTYPEACFCVPKSVMTDEQCQRCYESMSIGGKKSFIREGYMQGLITSAMFNELLDNDAFKTLYWDMPVIEKIDKSAYNQETAIKLLGKNNATYIGYIPEEYLTPEMCKKAVELDRHNISGVPIKYQSIELQKFALDQSYKTISSIPEEALSDEIIKYAINMNGHALSGIPKEKRTAEYCVMAFAKNPKSFAFIPDKYKTYDICVQAVLNDPLAIKNVPAGIMNAQFLQEIQSSYVVIPEKLMGYVQDCVKANERMERIINPEEIEQVQPTPVPKELSNISIDSLMEYFSTGSYTYLKNNNIETLQQLCNLVNQTDKMLMIKNKGVRNEITGTALLLKCKYLNEDPLIDTNDEKTILNDIADTIGVSIKAGNCLRRSGFMTETLKDFFNIVRTSDFDTRLRRAYGIGEKTYREIILKFRIITKYYDSLGNKTNNDVQANSESIDSSESLESLNAELQRLREERAKIDEQTDIVLAKIQAKMMSQSKGGVQR